MTLEASVLALRLRVLRRAQELGTVSVACREAGISRTLFYRWRQRFERYGLDGLHLRRRQARPGRPSQTPPHIERLVVGLALAWPTWGAARIAAPLAYQGLVRLAPSTVQRILRRTGLARRRDRLARLEAYSAGTCGLLTERTRRQLAQARQRARHLDAEQPGSWWAWTPSPSASSKAWGRSGRSRPATPRAPTASPGCCPRSRPTPRPTSSSSASCRSTGGPAGGSSAS